MNLTWVPLSRVRTAQLPQFQIHLTTDVMIRTVWHVSDMCVFHHSGISGSGPRGPHRAEAPGPAQQQAGRDIVNSIRILAAAGPCPWGAHPPHLAGPVRERSRPRGGSRPGSGAWEAHGSAAFTSAGEALFSLPTFPPEINYTSI